MIEVICKGGPFNNQLMRFDGEPTSFTCSTEIKTFVYTKVPKWNKDSKIVFICEE